MKSILFALSILLAAPAGSLLPLPALAAPAPLVQLPAALPAPAPRETAPNDRSEYRRLVLPNGMQVLLLSDPKLNVSSAALAVGVGSLADPPQRQGLAHFLEHMLFLGTQKYPDITAFNAYLQRNSGYNNAFTAEDRTNYFLEIRHDAFEGALDRFAQFFVAPLFDARFTEREMNAVASEHQKNLESDVWREQQLRSVAYAEGHAARHFGTGSKQTLTGVTRDELLAFYRTYYSANRMTLALTGRASLDQLEQWARTYFGPVIDHQIPPQVYPPDYMPKKAALRLLRMEPIKDLRQLNLEFPMVSLQEGWMHKSSELLGFILGGEGPGSLLAQLKAEGLATQLSAGAQASTRQYGAFHIGIGLTPQGLQRVPRVLELVFSAVRGLREEGLPAHLFKERQTLARLDERYRDKGEGGNLAAGLASLVMDYPLEVAERVPYLWLYEDTAAFQALLARLSPDNMLAMLIAKGQRVDRTEPIYGTRYSYEEDAGPAYTALLKPPRVDTLFAPKPNPFVPAHTALQPLQAARLVDEPAFSLYHLQDSEFQRPQAAYVLRHRLPRDLATVRTATLLRFYVACVREALNETTYVAAEAGLRFSLNASMDGVTLATEGYDEANGRLLDAVAPGLIDFQLSPARFSDLKDQLVRQLADFDNADAYVTTRETRRSLVREFYATPAQMLPLARNVTLEDVRAFARELFTRGKLEALAFGNLGPAEAVAATRRVASILKTQPVAADALLRTRLLVSKPGDVLRTRDALKVNNSTLRREYVLGDAGAQARAAALVLSAVIGDPFFSELRTRQQLGYIVQAVAFEDERQTVAVFIIQSGEYPANEQEARADAFIQTLPTLLRQLSPDAWGTVVAGVRARLQERDKSIAERAMRLFDLAYDKKGDWDRTQATLAALDTLTQARAGDILAQALDPKTRQMRTFLGDARQHPPSAADATAITDRDAWKRRQTYR
jgi:insulysin